MVLGTAIFILTNYSLSGALRMPRSGLANASVAPIELSQWNSTHYKSPASADFELSSRNIPLLLLFVIFNVLMLFGDSDSACAVSVTDWDVVICSRASEQSIRNSSVFL